MPAAGDNYFLYNSLAALNAPGEWYQDSANSKLYLQALNGLSPNGQNVEVRNRSNAASTSAARTTSPCKASA